MSEDLVSIFKSFGFVIGLISSFSCIVCYIIKKEENLNRIHGCENTELV
jgi:hypothetical protein